MKIEVAAIDMDETLLGEDGKVSGSTSDVLQHWLRSGRRLVIATGRPTRIVGEALPKFLHTVPWISYNGAAIHEQGVQIFSDCLSPELGREIVEYLQAMMPGCGIGMEVDGELHLNRATERARNYRVVDLSTLFERSAAKILCFGIETPVMRSVLAQTPAGSRAILSDKVHFAQIMTESADKAHALDFLVNRWGLSLANVIAFGDDINDTEMVRRVGMGVAMENAAEQVKAVAKRIAPHHKEDGVAQVLRSLL